MDFMIYKIFVPDDATTSHSYNNDCRLKVIVDKIINSQIKAGLDSHFDE